jgi:uncharacterized protein
VHLHPSLDGPPYVPVNLAFAGALLLAGRWAGLSWGELGLGRTGVGASAAVGTAVVGVVAIGLVVGVAVPELRPLVADARFEDRGSAAIAAHALYRVPLGTAVLEEVAFRGVLLAVLTALVGVSRAVVGSSVLFGLWHVRPGLGTMTTNGLTEWVPVPLGLGAIVAGTAVAGAGFCWLRLRTGHLAAPLVAHAGMNALGTVAAHVAHRLA